MTEPRDPSPYDPTDPTEQTQRHDLPGGTPAQRYSPPPEPRTDWTRQGAWTPTAQPTPERWYEPANPPAPAPVEPARPVRGGQGTGTVLASALLAAVLASGGTVLTLGATGALDRPAPAGTTQPTGTNVSVRQPVTVDESSATVSVAETASPAVVRIVIGSTNVGGGIIPESGVGSGVIYDPNGWILTNRHVVEGSGEITVELKDGREFEGEI